MYDRYQSINLDAFFPDYDPSTMKNYGINDVTVELNMCEVTPNSGWSVSSDIEYVEPWECQGELLEPID
jgi:hypothetical protein